MIVSGSSYKFSQEKIGYELYVPTKAMTGPFVQSDAYGPVAAATRVIGLAVGPKLPPTIVLASSLKSQGGASF